MTGPDRPGDELLGVSLGPYEVEGRLGAGATGVVYRGRDRRNGELVALKVLHEGLGSIGALRGRFEREARLLARLVHPNVVRIVGFGVHEQRTYIAMELLEGITLEQLLDEGPLDPRRALRIFTDMLRGLAFAHQQGIVHRDLKPANVFLVAATEAGVDGAHDRVKLLDFGLAKLLSDEGSGEGEERTLTRKGRIVGTPAYMAPEQITGVSLDVRADVYAAGVLLFELLADRRPFLHDRRSELLRAHLLTAPPPLSGAREGLEVHPDLAAVVHRALAKQPSARFDDARAMLAALLALAPNSARLTGVGAEPVRMWSGTTSEVISSSEREAVTRSVSVEAPAYRGSAPSRAPDPPGGFPDADARGVPTPVLFLVAALLFAAAAGIWLAAFRS